MREIYIKTNDAGQRLDKFLLKLMPQLPTSLLYKYLRKKCIKLNSKHVTDGAVRLNCGDVLNLYISDEFFSDNVDNKRNTQYVEGSLKVVYEDENLILINKPAGVSVHPDEKQLTGTLIDLLTEYLIYKRDYIPESEQSFAPALCNRLDRNTCGIVIAAKNAESLRELNEIIKNREIIKKYRCIVHGMPPKTQDTLKNYLVKNERDITVTVYDKPVKDGKTAILEYSLIKNITLNDGTSVALLDVVLHTGRTHQIRAQLSHIGCSIVGDGKYGKSYAQDKKNGYKYQALCSYYLRFELNNEYPLLNYLNGKEYSIIPNFN